MAEGAEEKSGANELTLSIRLGSFVLLVLYIAVAALKQSDAELVLPFSKFDVGTLLEQFKEGIPGGAFVAPILKIQVPLSTFYTLAPIVIVVLHAIVVWRRELLDKALPLLRDLAIWSPPVTIAIIRWRFTPFVFSRPTPPLAGQVLLGFHTLALFADAAIVAVALSPIVEPPGSTHVSSARSFAQLLRSVRQGVWVAITAFLLTRPLDFVWISGGGFKTDAWTYAAAFLSAAFGAVLMVLWLSGPRDKSLADMEDFNMAKRIGLSCAFIAFMALPTFAHGLDFSGESLVARAPSETMIAALIEARLRQNSLTQLMDMLGHPSKQPKDLPGVEKEAWDVYGRGISLAEWKFPSASFADATMAKIDLSGATLSRASFDRANLISAKFDGVHAEGASFRSTEAPDIKMRDARLANANFAEANLIKAHFDDAHAKGASFRSAEAPEITLGDAYLANANFAGADLKEADFDNAYAEGASFRSAEAQNITMRYAYLASANFAGAGLKGAMLTEADFVGADLNGADLTEANTPQKKQQVALAPDAADSPTAKTGDVTKGDPLEWDFNYCKVRPHTIFRNAHLEGAHLEGADLTCADFRGATFDGATGVDEDTIFAHADFCGAHLKGAKLKSATTLRTARLSWADIRGAELPVDVKLPPDKAFLYAFDAFAAHTDFSNAHLENADLRKLNLTNDNESEILPDAKNPPLCDPPGDKKAQ